MITEFLFPPHTEMDPSQAAMLKGLRQETQSMLLKYQLGTYAEDKLSGESAHKNRQREMSKLDVMLKKKQLGIPYTDDDMEGYRNESVLDRAKSPGIAVIMKETRPSVFAGASGAESIGEGLPYLMHLPKSPASGMMAEIIDLPRAALNSKSKQGLISSLLKALK